MSYPMYSNGFSGAAGSPIQPIQGTGGNSMPQGGQNPQTNPYSGIIQAPDLSQQLNTWSTMPRQPPMDSTTGKK